MSENLCKYKTNKLNCQVFFELFFKYTLKLCNYLIFKQCTLYTLRATFFRQKITYSKYFIKDGIRNVSMCINKKNLIFRLGLYEYLRFLLVFVVSFICAFYILYLTIPTNELINHLFYHNYNLFYLTHYP